MVEFTEEYLGNLLAEKLDGLDEYEEIVSLIESNSEGNIYLVGGTVSRTIVKALYGHGNNYQDFDFVVDKVKEKLTIPAGWKISYHKFGNPTFSKGSLEVDMFSFADYAHIKSNKLEPVIENFLAGVPFTIQSLAFDIKSQKLIGKVGIKAIKNRCFEVHNIENAKSVANRKGVSINERMLQKARSMGFEIIPCNVEIKK